MSIDRIKASRVRGLGWSFLVLTGSLATLPVAGTALAQGPDEIHLTGIVRDFLASHPDFNVTPAGGFGHYARNVDETLGAGERPTFSPMGYKVNVEWTDVAGRTIAPHMYMVDASGGEILPNILTNGRIRGRNTSSFDSYDSSVGPYGGLNVGAAAVLATNSIAPSMIVLDNSSMLNGDALIGPGGDPAVVVDAAGGSTITGTISNLAATIDIPPIAIPGDMPAYSATDLNFPVNSNLGLAGDHHVDLFNVRRNATVTIIGDVRVICEDRFLINKDAVIIVPDGASLTVYCKTQMRMYGPDSIVNPDTTNPDKVRIFIIGSDRYNDQLVINGGASKLCARVTAPNNVLDLDQDAEFFGTFIGDEIEINNSSQVHMDVRPYEMIGGCLVVDDLAGVEGPAGNGGCTSAATYAEWYHDVLGVNQSKAHPITLTRDVDGVYEYLNDAFYPIDDQLLGNEGDTHNLNYTFAIEAEITYESCTGQFVSFQGGDGTWMFIDQQLVLDIGGVMPVGEQIIELDRLGLVDGETYRVHLFYANRNAMSAVYRLRTNVQLSSNNVLPSFLALFD